MSVLLKHVTCGSKMFSTGLIYLLSSSRRVLKFSTPVDFKMYLSNLRFAVGLTKTPAAALEIRMKLQVLSVHEFRLGCCLGKNLNLEITRPCLATVLWKMFGKPHFCPGPWV